MISWVGPDTPQKATLAFKRVSVSVPFGVEAWKKHFCPLLRTEAAVTTDTVVTVTALSDVLGRGWDCRSYKTSTETYVSKMDGVRVMWGFKPRINFNHGTCLR